MPENNELSEREQEILKLVATGASNKEIARKLTISTNTVKVHLRNIFAKIGVASRTEAAMYAVQTGVVATASHTPDDQSAFQALRVENDYPQGARIWRWLVGAFITMAAILIALALINRLSAVSNSTGGPAEPSQKPEWVAIRAMPTARFGMAAAVYESRIYLIGGDLGGGVTGVVERYDPGTDAWETLAEKPVPVADVHAAVVGGKFYIPGGRLASGEVTDILEIYDPRLDQWSTGTSLPQKLAQYALAVYEGKIYLFGGWDGESYSTSVYEYDPDLDAWQGKSPLSSARAYSAAIEVEGKIYLLGGYDGKKALNLGEIYAPALDDGKNKPWSKGERLPGGGRYGAGAASLMNILFLIAGNGAGTTSNPAVLGFDIGAGEWQQISPLPGGGLFSPGAVAFGNHLYLFGGQNERGEVTSVSLSYQVYYITVLPFVR